ncbi:hypothetical protein CLF_100618 [Clonorchis sinensis]|uniref:Laminin G domain-containing protein n=1 Tax=Clonorchis sinensis TaxID=79923 RepID=G7Y3V4_CLOSI|nr:hypothetical protein CLF_100618 [Clonorchis sinensis]
MSHKNNKTGGRLSMYSQQSCEYCLLKVFENWLTVSTTTDKKSPTGMGVTIKRTDRDIRKSGVKSKEGRTLQKLQPSSPTKNHQCPVTTVHKNKQTNHRLKDGYIGYAKDAGTHPKQVVRQIESDHALVRYSFLQVFQGVPHTLLMLANEDETALHYELALENFNELENISWIRSRADLLRDKLKGKLVPHWSCIYDALDTLKSGVANKCHHYKSSKPKNDGLPNRRHRQATDDPVCRASVLSATSVCQPTATDIAKSICKSRHTVHPATCNVHTLKPLFSHKLLKADVWCGAETEIQDKGLVNELTAASLSTCYRLLNCRDLETCAPGFFLRTIFPRTVQGKAAPDTRTWDPLLSVTKFDYLKEPASTWQLGTTDDRLLRKCIEWTDFSIEYLFKTSLLAITNSTEFSTRSACLYHLLMMSIVNSNVSENPSECPTTSIFRTIKIHYFWRQTDDFIGALPSSVFGLAQQMETGKNAPGIGLTRSSADYGVPGWFLRLYEDMFSHSSSTGEDTFNSPSNTDAPCSYTLLSSKAWRQGRYLFKMRHPTKRKCAPPKRQLSVDNYAVFPPFIPCPRATMSFEFQTTQPTGLLVYSEDNSTGRFLSITLLPMHRLKVELELRLPQYRTSRDHTTMVLDFATSHWKEPVEKGHQLWHFFNMTMSSGQTGNILSGLIIHLDEKRFVHQFTPALIYSAPLSHKTPKVYFGEPLYIGQIPDHMRSDATKRSLFSSAMQPTYNGLIQNLQLGECSVQELRGCKMSEGWRMCDTLTPAELNNGAVYIPDSRGLRVSGDECPHRTPAQSTKYIKPDVHTVSDLKTSLNQEQHRCFVVNYIAISSLTEERIIDDRLMVEI